MFLSHHEVHVMNRAKIAGHQQPQAGYERIVPGSASTEESDRELRPRYRATSRARLRTHQAPVFQPTEAEFADFAQYVTQIAQTAAPCGIAKIVPPSSWKGPPKVRLHNQAQPMWKQALTPSLRHRGRALTCVRSGYRTARSALPVPSINRLPARRVSTRFSTRKNQR